MSRTINRHNTGIVQHLLRQQPVIRPAAVFCSNTSIKIKFVCSDIEVDFEYNLEQEFDHLDDIEHVLIVDDNKSNQVIL